MWWWWWFFFYFTSLITIFSLLHKQQFILFPLQHKIKRQKYPSCFNKFSLNYFSSVYFASSHLLLCTTITLSVYFFQKNIFSYFVQVKSKLALFSFGMFLSRIAISFCLKLLSSLFSHKWKFFEWSSATKIKLKALFTFVGSFIRFCVCIISETFECLVCLLLFNLMCGDIDSD